MLHILTLGYMLCQRRNGRIESVVAVLLPFAATGSCSLRATLGSLPTAALNFPGGQLVPRAVLGTETESNFATKVLF